MDQADMDAEAWTPAGPATYGRFMQIRVFDMWIHELDIADAVGRSADLDGTAVQRTLAEVTNGIGYAVGKLAATPDGTSVRFTLTGAQPATIDVVVDGRARVADDLEGEPTVSIATDVAPFVRLIAGRRTGPETVAAGVVEVSGDQQIGARVLDHLAYTI